MEFFLDSADLNLVRTFKKMGLIAGVTSNPAIMANKPDYTILSSIIRSSMIGISV